MAATVARAIYESQTYLEMENLRKIVSFFSALFQVAKDFVLYFIAAFKYFQCGIRSAENASGWVEECGEDLRVAGLRQ